MPRKKVEETKLLEQFEVNWEKIKEQVAEAKDMIEKGLVKPEKKTPAKKLATKKVEEKPNKKATKAKKS